MKMKMMSAAPKKQRAMHPCPACTANGVVDFVDLVRGRAQLHCPDCPTSWAEQTEATMKYLSTD
jgi:formate dehydrogenase maturation protein FdhE